MIDRNATRILVLDDEQLIVEVLAHNLADLGFAHVTTCTNGYHALNLVDAPGGGFDVILCDLKMPDLDGVQFVRHLVGKGYRGGIVLISGLDERIVQATHSLVSAHGIDVIGYLCKPFLPRELAAMLDGWVPQAEPRQPVPTKIYAAAEIRAAIAAGELMNHYQPRIDLATGAFTGVEVFVRWRHPTDGLIYPAQFIDTAESVGTISDLTRFVLQGVFRERWLWGRHAVPLSASINVSMDQLDELDFPDFVADFAAVAGVPAARLVLEVTESHVLHDPLLALEILTRLRLKGFGIAVDLFGTGHSSLAQLRHLPFTELKLDRSLVAGAWRNQVTHAIFNSGLALGAHIGIGVVAEGVETRDDWNFVRRSGCRTAQGYFIADPMPAKSLPEWAEHWNARLATEDLLLD